MTEHPLHAFRLTVREEPATLTVRISGDLDHDTGPELVDAVSDHLTPGVRDVRLDFHALGHIDSLGLSALLMVHRRTSAAGAALHLDHRPAALERVLRQTNVLTHLTGAVGPAAPHP
ncbi:STAS domain-containing protein [Streptomyces sp. NPDC001595]|uniref:STAS domain-containing protein n=1 Tax=Streptomyces sp. NPDC001532 TaxID=3154520 RepID=UPI00331A84CF